MEQLPCNAENGFNHSFVAWQEWNLVDANVRCEVVSDFISSLPSTLKNVGQYQLAHSRKVTEKTHQLTGPTGETNELYVAGRGVGILVVDSEEEQSKVAAVAMLVSMLVAGNSVIVCSDDGELNQALTFQKSGQMPLTNMVQCVPFDAYREYLDKDIKNFAFIGNEQAALEINKLLALRTGAITALVSETDLNELPQSQDPQLVLRFITERTRTINITAVGGNATLLELGSETK